MDKFSFLGAAHTNMIDEMYQQYLKDDSNVEEKWKNFFQGFDFAQIHILILIRLYLLKGGRTISLK